MSNMKIKLNHDAFRAFLQGEEVQKMLEKHASNVAKNSGGEYKVSVAPTRAIAIVTGDDGNNSLLRAMR